MEGGLDELKAGLKCLWLKMRKLLTKINRSSLVQIENVFESVYEKNEKAKRQKSGRLSLLFGMRFWDDSCSACHSTTHVLSSCAGCQALVQGSRYNLLSVCVRTLYRQISPWLLLILIVNWSEVIWAPFCIISWQIYERLFLMDILKEILATVKSKFC